MMDKENSPLPAALMAAWLDDNARFQRELVERDNRLGDLSDLRTQLEPNIRVTEPAESCALSAVDAACIRVPLGDQLSILVQVVRVDADGSTHLGPPERITGIDGNEFRLAEMPMRMAAECRELAAANNPTIADTSYWSFLMEANQAITRRESNSSLPALEEAVKGLIDDGTFVAMVQNPLVVPMSKTSQSDHYVKGVSDRHILTQVLRPDEYLLPTQLTAGTTGHFGIEKRRFKSSERALLDEFYKRHLGVLFYKPHPWSRAFRVEGHLERLLDHHWLMALLSAIKAGTAINRLVVEPWPQYMADYTAKRLSAVAKLYGNLNWHRFGEDSNYPWPRTKRK
jgi:hypothetical protein